MYLVARKHVPPHSAEKKPEIRPVQAKRPAYKHSVYPFILCSTSLLCISGKIIQAFPSPKADKALMTYSTIRVRPNGSIRPSRCCWSVHHMRTPLFRHSSATLLWGFLDLEGKLALAMANSFISCWQPISAQEPTSRTSVCYPSQAFIKYTLWTVINKSQ